MASSRTRRSWNLGQVLTAIGFVAVSGFLDRPSYAQVPQRTFAPVYHFESERLLRTAEQRVREEQWNEAIDLYLRVIQQHAGRVTALPKGDPESDPTGQSRLYLDARLYCQRRIAALPPEARRQYRARVDNQAESWYKRGLETGDPTWWRRVVEEAFCSSFGDDAIERLGDAAFRAGRFGEALASYGRIAPEPGIRPSGIVYPDPDLDRGRIAAKLILSRAALGLPIETVLAAYEKEFPDAKGPLAGRDGLYAASVRAAIEQDDLVPGQSSDERWPTFAGSPDRARPAPEAIDLGSFLWRAKLDTPPLARQPAANLVRMGGGRLVVDTPSNTEPPPAFHPIILGDQVVVCDDNRVVAFHLGARTRADSSTGAATQLLAWDQKLRNQLSEGPMFRAPPGGVVRHTLTASGDRILARLGGQGNRGAGSTLIAIRNNRQVEGKRIWERTATDIPLLREDGDTQARHAAFEGAPVADERSVYIALTELGAETGCYVAALDAETGSTRWVRYLGNSNAPVDQFNFQGNTLPNDVGHRLLSLDDQSLYYVTHMGAVAALDIETGMVRWLATYPTRDRPATGPWRREANPAAVQDGLVVIAPDDAAPIFAFEAATGKLAWKSPPLDKAVHLLGFGSGGIVATGDHVWMIDPGAGTIKSTWPEVGSYDGYGRGLLAGGSIYWPTRTDIKVLDQAAGTPGGHSPIRLQQQFGTSGGNLAVGDGYLVIAQRDALVVFAGNARLIEDYREEIAREPTNAASRFRLARVAEAIGEDTLALENLQKAVELARPEDTLDGRALADEARGRLHRIRMKLGAQALEAKQYETAADHLAAAAAAATGDRDRLAARLKLAEAQEGRGDLATAVATLQTILADEKLRLLTVEVDAPDSGRFVRAEVWIARGLERLLRQGGRSLYAGYDAEAKRLLERGEAADDPRQIEAIAAAYPVAEIVPDAWASLGRMHARLDRPAAAARAWKRLLASAPNDTWRALALVELAAVLETQGLGTEAREAYLQAKTRYGDVELPPRLAGSAPASISARVSERLARAPLAGLLDARLEPDLAWPLERRTEVRWPTPLRPILPAGLPEGEAPHFFALDGVKLRPLQLETDSPQWTADLEQAPQWLGYAAGRLIAATPTRFAAFDTRSGQLVWQYPAPGGAEAAGEPAGAQADPFARENSSTPRGRFHSVRLVSDQILCLQGDRSVLALDAETGSPNWIESPPSGSILPHWLVNPSRVAVQLRGPSLLLVLDTRSGRRLAQFPRAEEDGYWARDPFPLDDDRAAVVLDSRAVALLDLTRGVHLWTQQNRVVLPSASLPRFLGNAEHLILVSEGGELARLNPNTGDHLWNRRLTLDDLTETPDSLAIDPEQLYAAAAGKLHALDLDDGEITWSRPLAGPDSHWRLNLVERHVLAYPAPPSGTDAKLDELPILALRRDSGRPTQRIVISGPIHELALRHDARGLELVFDHGAWTLNTAEQAFNPP